MESIRHAHEADKKDPIRFLPAGDFTPTLPPMAL